MIELVVVIFLYCIQPGYVRRGLVTICLKILTKFSPNLDY